MREIGVNPLSSLDLPNLDDGGRILSGLAYDDSQESRARAFCSPLGSSFRTGTIPGLWLTRARPLSALDPAFRLLAVHPPGERDQCRLQPRESGRHPSPPCQNRLRFGHRDAVRGPDKSLAGTRLRVGCMLRQDGMRSATAFLPGPDAPNVARPHVLDENRFAIVRPLNPSTCRARRRRA